jgi:type 1 fimbria pilin
VKQVFFIPVLIVAMGSSTFANAEGSNKSEGKGDLQVKAIITAPSCTLNLSEANIDLGVLNPSELKKETYTLLPKKEHLTVKVDCLGRTMVNMSIIDAHADTLTKQTHATYLHPFSDLNKHFGLVDANDSDRLIGSYHLKMTNVHNEEGTRYNIYGAVTDYWSDTFMLSSISPTVRTPETAMFRENDNARTPQSSKKLTIEFEVQPRIMGTTGIDRGLDGVVSFVGESTFKMFYM